MVPVTTKANPTAEVAAEILRLVGTLCTFDARLVVLARCLESVRRQAQSAGELPYDCECYPPRAAGQA